MVNKLHGWGGALRDDALARHRESSQAAAGQPSGRRFASATRILVFGPGGSGKGVSVPDVATLPRERRYIDNLPSIQWNEFTVYQSLCFPAAVYPVLAQGGKWDETKDPFAVGQK